MQIMPRQHVISIKYSHITMIDWQTRVIFYSGKFQEKEIKSYESNR